MTRVVRDALASLLVAAALAAAISFVWWAMITKARADGLLVPPPPPPVYDLPPPGAGVLPYTLPYRQGPPTRSCVETAIQLGYQTGNRYVANAAVAACRAYAPVQYPRKYPPPLPLGYPG
jgi:hypothetical protein